MRHISVTEQKYIFLNGTLYIFLHIWKELKKVRKKLPRKIIRCQLFFSYWLFYRKICMNLGAPCAIMVGDTNFKFCEKLFP